jgi:Serine endopeptidase inhibitors
MSNNEQALPFFARYLEGQFCEDLSEEEMSTVQGGLKFAYPTRPQKDAIFTTLKYPSDNEESGPVVTKKYPSDADEYAVTMKYPSDGDDYVVVETVDSVNTSAE